MNQNWLWDKNITEDAAKKILQDTVNPEFIFYAALLLSRKNSAQEVFKEYLKQKDFVIFWQRIKKQMRKNSWNDPRIEYWQAIYETLKAKSLEFAGLREEKNQQFYSPLLKEIGLTIKNEREKKEITQKELAFNLKISQQIISRIEKGKQNISIETLEKICNALGLPIDIEKFGFKKDAKLSIILSRYVLPFWSKTPEEFENLCYAYLKRFKEYDDLTLNRGIGDKGRDIIGYKFSIVGKKEKWYFQCKNYEKISYKDFKKEIDKIKKHSDEIENFKPDKIIFITACPVSPECRDKTKEYANNLGLNEIEIWNDVELTERVESIKGLKEEFFPVGITKEDLKEETGDIKQEFKIVGTYNNLGVCEIRKNDYNKAKEYIEKALKLAPEFIPAKTNLTSIYLNIGGNDQKAYEITMELWKLNKKDTRILHNLIQSICNYKSPKEAISFYEKSEEARLLVGQNDKLLNLLGRIYLISGEINKAMEFADKALRLSPDASYHFNLKAKILMAQTQINNIIPAYFKLIPSNSIKIEQFNKEKIQQLKIYDVITNLENKNFETAYNLFIEQTIWDKITYEEKLKIANIFFMKGAPEESKNILKKVEAEAEQRKDIQFWIGMSTNAVLLEEKNLAINSVQKAKEFSSGTKFEKTTLSHFNALIYRYRTQGEVDRWMRGITDYNNKYPEEGIVKLIKAFNNVGEPTEEIKTIFSDNHKWYKNVKNIFKSQSLPSYMLEEIFKKPYASILSFQYDPDMKIPFFITSEQVINKLTDNLEKARNLVFDYASLLNLAKMNLLSHLEKLNKNIFICEELFIKIQNELLVFEHEDLRRLWNFLRKSKEIQIIEEAEAELNEKDINEKFDKWIIDSAKLAKIKDAVFIIDDLRTLNFFEQKENIKVCNSLVILNNFLSKEWIDEKIFSTSLGDLAERFYTFLPFNGYNLYQIAMEDNAKITLRSQHLINQLFLPGSIPESFIKVFIEFIELLWKSGLLPEDKVRWLEFLTDCFFKYLNFFYEQPKDTDVKYFSDFLQVWGIAIQRSNIDELTLLDKKIDDKFTDLTKTKDYLKRIINMKINTNIRKG